MKVNVDTKGRGEYMNVTEILHPLMFYDEY
jgi:hypothetical protein